MSDEAVALASPEDVSSAFPDVAVAVAASPVVVLVVVVLALAPEPVTVPVPEALIGAVTVVAPTDALLVCVVFAVTDSAPPALAALLVDGVTVCVIAPVGPASSQPLPHDRVESAMVMVDPPVAVLSASGELVIDVLPLELLLEAYGLTVTSLLVTSPEPDALGFDHTSALPPYVSLDVLELAWALALPLEASSAEPLVALAAAAAPVVVAVVVDVALAGEPLTVPVPVAAIPALTVVSPVVAELVWLVLAAIVVAPLPAVAELLTDGVTVCETAPVEPSHSDSKKQFRPVLAFVPVNPPEASLLAYGLLSMVVLPVWLELSAPGSTCRLLPETEPVPDA